MMRLTGFVVFVLVLVFGLATSSADTFNLASFTFDDTLGPTTAGPVAPDQLFNFNSFSAQFIPVSEQGNDFDIDLTIGTLMFGLAGQGGLSVVLGNDVVRRTMEVTWGGAAGVTNQAGDDFVVYENGSPGGPEAYMVAVRPTGSPDFTDFRYEFADDFFNEPPPGPDIAQVLSTGFDLGSFGLASGATIDAIRFSNLISDDTVDGADGQGTVILGGGGGFTPLTGPQGAGGPFNSSGFDPDITYVGVIPTAPIPGDFNGDGNVDGEDFLIWQSSFNSDDGGDANGDGVTDGDDFLIWQSNFGSGSGGGSTAVPEPSSALLIVILASMVAASQSKVGRGRRFSGRCTAPTPGDLSAAADT